MPQPQDLYQFSSGLIDNFDFEVTDGKYATNTRIDKTGETWFLTLEGKTDDPDQPILEDDAAVCISVGKKFVSEDGGKTVEHESGKPMPYSKNSYIAEFLARAASLNAAVRTDINPYDARTWVGTKWSLKRESKAYNVNGQTGTSEKLMPVAYLGKASAGTETKQDASPAPAVVTGSLTTDPVLNAKLKAAAVESSDVDDFQTAALSLDGLPDDLQINLVDAEYATKVYAELKG